MSEKAQIETSQTESASRATPSTGVMTIALALIVALGLAAGGVGGYIGWKKLTVIEQTSTAKVEELQTQLSALHTQLGTQQQQIQKQQEKLHVMLASASTANQSWQVAQAQYLIQLANFSVEFDHNPTVAIQLLQAADNRLTTLHEPRLISVRQSITNNLTALKGVPQVDIPTILLQLNALGAQVGSLPAIATPNDVPKSKTNKKKHRHQPGWQRGLKQSWQELTQIIVVQYHDQPVGQLITPQNRNYLDLHLQMLLAEAQWACLHQNGELYKTSLQQANDWVKNYYVESSAVTQAMLTELNTLLQKDISPTMPDISSALDNINTYLSNDTPPPAPAVGAST